MTTQIETAPDRRVIILRVQLPAGPGPAAVEMPQHRHFPSAILCELLENILRHWDLPAQVNGYGSLENCVVYLSNVNEPHSTCNRILESLKRIGLHEFCTLHRWDEREGFLRPVHIGKGSLGVDQPLPFTWNDLQVDYEAILAQQAADVEFLKTLKRILPEPPAGNAS